MKFLISFFVCVSLILGFLTEEGNAAIACFGEDYGSEYAVFSLGHDARCSSSMKGENMYNLIKPSSVGTTNVCGAYKFPTDFVITKVFLGDQCGSKMGGDQYGTVYSIKKPHPAGDVMCKNSPIPAGFKRGEATFKEGCEDRYMYPDGKNAWNIYDTVYANSRPPAPSNLNAAYTDALLLFTWENPSTIFGEVSYFEIQIFKNGQLIAEIDKESSEEMSYWLPYVTYGNYTFNIRSVKITKNKTLYSDYSTYDITAGVSVPAPYDLNLRYYASTVTLKWQMPANVSANDVTRYDITMMLNGNIIKTESADSSKREWSFDNLADGNYMFQIRAVRNIALVDYFSDYSRAEITLNPVPSPEDFNATVSGDNITVNWNYNSDADSFTIKYRKSSKPGWSYVSLPSKARSYIASNLFRGAYDFTLQAYNNGRRSNSVYTSAALDKPSAPLTEYLPYDPTGRIVDNSKVYLSWNLPAVRGDKISVVWYTGSDPVRLNETIISPDSASYTIENISDGGGVNVNVEVRVIKDGKYSDIVSQKIYVPLYSQAYMLETPILDYSVVVPEGLTMASYSGPADGSPFTIHVDGELVYDGNGEEKDQNVDFPVLSGHTVTINCLTQNTEFRYLTLTKKLSAGRIEYFNSLADENGNIHLSWSAPRFEVDQYLIFICSRTTGWTKYSYSSDSTSATISGLKDGTYEIEFVALSNGRYSDVVKATVEAKHVVPEGSPVSYRFSDLGDGTSGYIVPDGYNIATVAIGCDGYILMNVYLDGNMIDSVYIESGYWEMIYDVQSNQKLSFEYVNQTTMGSSFDGTITFTK